MPSLLLPALSIISIDFAAWGIFLKYTLKVSLSPALAKVCLAGAIAIFSDFT